MRRSLGHSAYLPTPELLSRLGGAVTPESFEYMLTRLDDSALDVDAASVLVLLG